MTRPPGWAFTKWLMLLTAACLALTAYGTFVASPAWADDEPKPEAGCREPGPTHSVLGVPSDADVDYILELKPGEDPVHWAHFVLAAAEVDDAEQDARIIYTYVCAINGVWLRLTPTEAAAIDDLTGARPDWAKAGSRAYRVSAPVVESSVVVDYTLSSPQRQPAWLDRLQWTGPTADHRGNPLVAILDTGIDSFHADLVGTVVGGYDCTHEYEDRWRSDPHGHSTHVWGAYAALDNDSFVEGAVPGMSGLSIPVLTGEGVGSSASVLCGIDQAMLLGADIANLSLGGGSTPSECGGLDPSHNGFCNAVAAGLIVVVAAGNDAMDAYFQAPANYPEVITVGAIATYLDGQPVPGCSVGTPENSAASFTSFGPVVDVVAPGVCNLSTIPGNGTAWASGTSMATPVVGAVIADHLYRCGPSVLTVDSDGGTFSDRDVWAEVLDWSERWMSPDTDEGTGEPAGQYVWNLGPTQPPLIRFGAPCGEEQS